MTINELLSLLKTSPDSLEFDQVMDTIKESYKYSPAQFTNGELVNEAGANEGSCKIFYFAQLNDLSEAETLALFGKYYREDVLGKPEGEDHGNIRNFMLTGWAGVKFTSHALVRI